jgi:hypothetical protein
MDCRPGWAGGDWDWNLGWEPEWAEIGDWDQDTALELIFIRVGRGGGGDWDCNSVKGPGVMVARQDGPHGVARCDWTPWRKWSVIADCRLDDAIAENEPPTE